MDDGAPPGQQTNPPTLGQLTLRARLPKPVLGHVYVDERLCSDSNMMRRTTVAAAHREHRLPLTDDQLPIDIIASTAAFALMVTYCAKAEGASSVLGSILASLSTAEIGSVTVHRPLEVSPEEDVKESASAWHDYTSLFDFFGDTRRLNWLGNGAGLADLLEMPVMLPRLEYGDSRAAVRKALVAFKGAEHRRQLARDANLGEGEGMIAVA